ncbi:site-specific integrase [Nocardioides nanhaiensis]|uniref:Site-specific integrase n=1 Tax=Nocardioides nanhaiensis TaxID=1476871 RepID=A0ABP8VV09_9ACTN
MRNHRPGCLPKWQFVHDLPSGSGGKRRQTTKGGFRTRRDAQRALRASLDAVDLGILPAGRTMTVGEFLDSWVAGRVDLRRSTRNSYEGHIRLYLKPGIGHVRLDDLRHEHVEHLFAVLASRTERPLSATTLHRIKATLRKALNDAVKRRQMLHNPALHVDLPRATPYVYSTWTPAELRYFLNFIRDDDLYAALHLAALTGMRRGEVAGLQWANVDVERGRLRVINSRVEVGASIEDELPKSSSGERFVYLDDGTLQALSAHRQRMAELWGGEALEGHCYVFPGPKGGPMRPELIYRRLQRLAERAGLPKLRLHDVRHTHATHALEAGVPMKVVQDRLGHASMYLTADTYSHVQPAVADRAAADVARLVFDSHGLALAGGEQIPAPSDRDGRQESRVRRSDVVGPVGLEPTTNGLKVRSSAS